MGGQLGLLRNHGAVNVANFPALCAHAARGFLQQHPRVCALEFNRSVGKVAANVAQPRCAQNGVGDGMQQHVGIGVAQQPLVVGDLDPTNDELAAFHQRVGIPAFTNTKIHSYSRFSLAG